MPVLSTRAGRQELNGCHQTSRFTAGDCRSRLRKNPWYQLMMLAVSRNLVRNAAQSSHYSANRISAGSVEEQLALGRKSQVS
jgi:hypothetical protein